MARITLKHVIGYYCYWMEWFCDVDLCDKRGDYMLQTLNCIRSNLKFLLFRKTVLIETFYANKSIDNCMMAVSKINWFLWRWLVIALFDIFGAGECAVTSNHYRGHNSITVIPCLLYIRPYLSRACALFRPLVKS